MKNVIEVFILLGLLSCTHSGRHEKAAVQEAAVINLPANAIHFIFQNGIIIRMKVNDSIDGNFLFDSGSDQLYLDSTFLTQNKILYKSSKMKMIQGVGSNTPVVRVIENIKLGIDTLYKLYKNVPITNIKKLAKNFEIAGVFGTDFFKDYVLKINFDSSYFQIIEPLKFNVPIGFDSLKLFLVENKTFIKCSVIITDSIKVDGFAMLDLGSRYGMTFTSAIAEERKFNDLIKYKYYFTNKNAGYGRTSSSYFFRAESLNIGNFKLTKPIMNYASDKKGALSMWGTLGLLGIQVIERFNLFFDFRFKKLYFKPNSRFKEHFYSEMTGISGRLDKMDNIDGYIVECVIENSPAQIAGIRVDDIITHLNGIRISSFSDAERKKLFYQDTLELYFDILRGRTNFKTKLLPKEML